MATYIEVSVQNLHLDSENPRHNQILDESLIVKHLYENEKVGKLLRDVAIRGLSPFETIGVIPIADIEGHYLVVEGNRRICALKLLTDENLAPTEQIKSQIAKAKLLIESPLPERITVSLLQNLEEALPWMDRRHLGELDGVGTRAWGAQEQARSLARSNSIPGRAIAASQNILAQAIIDRLSKLRLLSDSQKSMVPITTLSRYLSTPTVRDVLGLGDNSELIYNFEDSEVDHALHIFVLDSLPLSEGGNELLNSRTDASDRRAYAVEFATRNVRPSSVRLPPGPPSEIVFHEPSDSQSDANNTGVHQSDNANTEKSDEQPNSNKTSQRRSTADPSSRVYLVDTSFVVKAPDDKVLIRLLTEMRRLPVDGHEFSANYLLRAFVERVMIRFLLSNNKIAKGANLTDQKITEHARDLATTLNADRGVTQVLGQAASNPMIGHSLSALGSAVHGSHIPTKRELLSKFDTWRAALIFMLDHGN
ncbi:hypothetical protein [Pseudomethylobacillus aquaticus]|uniref:hypothetical protein n=1 Tax=Pseudomethylobacillus aquaticus TaxID=2676064 RepID=UPI0011CE3ABD|nr:hypothetical protein [Pseudomethylobacillus aquaticus]